MKTGLIQFFLYALLAVSAENVVFSGGIGISRVLRASRKPLRMLLCYGLLVSAFSAASMAVSLLLGPLLDSWGGGARYRPVIFGVSAAALYFLAVFLLKSCRPRLYRRLEPVLSPAAINCVVLSLPFLGRFLRLGAWESMGFAVGTGAAFLIASLLVSEAIPDFQDERVPRAFRGLPATLIYVGILSLALVGISGGRVF